MVKRGVKEEFEALASRISRLESLRDELDALDTRGFEAEVHLIRARLKDVNALPQLEREMSELRRKIKSRQGGEVKTDNTQHKMLKESAVLKHKIAELEKLITQKKDLFSKKQLNHKEMEFIKDIPQLERALASLRKDFHTHISSAHVKVDTGVGVVVDSKFDDFIAELKAELTKRVQEKELAMGQTLKHDLALHEEAFSTRYKQLVDDFHQRYRERVQHELKREVSHKLESEVNARLAEERQRLLATLAHENMSRLETERKHITVRLERVHEAKMKQLTSKLAQLQKKERVLNARAKTYAHGRETMSASFERMRLSHQKQLDQKQRTLNVQLAEVSKREKVSKQRVQVTMGLLSRKLAALQQEHVRLHSHTSALQRLKARKSEELEHFHQDIQHMQAKEVEKIKKSHEALRKMKERQEAIVKGKLAALDTRDHERARAAARSIRDRLAREKKSYEQQHRELVTMLHKRKEQQLYVLSAKMAALNKKLEQAKKEEKHHVVRHAKQAQELMKRFEMMKTRHRVRILQQEKQLHARLAHVKQLEQGQFEVLTKERQVIHDKLQKLERLKQAEQARLVSEARAKESKLKATMERRITQGLKAREGELRRRLEQEYATRMRTELQRRSAEFDKRKAELEEHIINQAKRFFK